MLIGDIFYYRMNRRTGEFTRLPDFDRDTPRPARLRPTPDELAIWTSRNGPSESVPFAGRDVLRRHGSASAAASLAD